MFAMYEEIKKYKRFLFLRFEWFHEYDYRQSVAYFIEQIAPKTKRTPDQIDRIGRVMTEMNEVVIGPQCNDTVKTWGTCGHITRGKYDMELQIGLLMEYDERICVLLKNMTLVMDGKWSELDNHC